MAKIIDDNIRIEIADRRLIPWVCIHREGLEDHRLSFCARGILAYVSAQPSNIVPDVPTLVALSPNEGVRAIQAALRELNKAGYTTTREE